MSEENKTEKIKLTWEPVGEDGKVWHCGCSEMFYEILKHDMRERSYYSAHVYIEGSYATQIGDRGSLPEAKALAKMHIRKAIDGLIGGGI